MYQDGVPGNKVTEEDSQCGYQAGGTRPGDGAHRYSGLTLCPLHRGVTDSISAP